MEIGSKLKRLRIKNNLTQEELADRCELSKGFISQIERDLASPSISTLSDLLQCLGTDLKDFFNDARDTDVVFTKEDVFVKAGDVRTGKAGTECTQKKIIIFDEIGKEIFFGFFSSLINSDEKILNLFPDAVTKQIYYSNSNNKKFSHL